MYSKLANQAGNTGKNLHFTDEVGALPYIMSIYIYIYGNDPLKLLITFVLSPLASKSK